MLCQCLADENLQKHTRSLKGRHCNFVDSTPPCELLLCLCPTMPLGDTSLIPVVANLELVYDVAYLLRHHHTNITPFLLSNYYKSLKDLHNAPKKLQRPWQSFREASSSQCPCPAPRIDIANIFS